MGDFEARLTVEGALKLNAEIRVKAALLAKHTVQDADRITELEAERGKLLDITLKIERITWREMGHNLTELQSLKRDMTAIQRLIKPTYKMGKALAPTNPQPVDTSEEHVNEEIPGLAINDCAGDCKDEKP